VETLPAGGHRINLQRFEHGLSSEKHIPREFFDSAEYLRIAELAQTLSDLMAPARSSIAATIGRKSPASKSQ